MTHEHANKSSATEKVESVLRAMLERKNFEINRIAVTATVASAIVAIVSVVFSVIFLRSQITTLAGAYVQSQKTASIELFRDWDRAFDATNRARFDAFIRWTETSPGEVTGWMQFFIDGNITTQMLIDANKQQHPWAYLKCLFPGGELTPSAFEDYKYSLTTILNVMEGIAVARHRGAADPQMLDDSYAESIPRYVTKLQLFIDKYREKMPKAWLPLSDVIKTYWMEEKAPQKRTPDPVRNLVAPKMP